MRSHVVQSNFLSGVLHPSAAGRVETDAYNNGMLRGINVEPVHLGGVRRRRGWQYRAVMPNQLTRIASDVTITTPRGGTGANANDDSEATTLQCTTDVSTIDPYVMVHYDLGSAKAVLFADVLGIVSTSGSSTQFAIQYSTDNVTFTTLGSALQSVDTTARTYRRAGPVTARYWRVAKIGGTDMGAVDVALTEFNLWQDSGTVSEGRSISFEVSTDEQYTVVLTDRSATIFNNGVLADRQPMPYESADLADIDAAPNAETMALVHEDYPQRFLVRESATNFQTFEMEFDDVPQVDFGDSSSPTPTSEVQVITFDANWRAGDTFQVSLMGARSETITFAGDAGATDQAATAANIAQGIQKLWTVQAFTGVSCARTGALAYTVTFAGASADTYQVMGVTAVSHSSATTPGATVGQSAAGVSRKEPLWSATRGYPRTAEYFEGRLYFGGTRAKQQSLIGSGVNNTLGYDLGEGLADDPILVTLNGRTLNAIQGLFAGRSLQLFTSGGEFRYAKEQGTPIEPGDAPVNQTQYGAAKIKPVTLDGATLYVQRNRKSIRDFRFDYTENAYNSLGVSSLAAHLIYDVRDIAAWNGSAVDEIGLLFVVNGTNPALALSNAEWAALTAAEKQEYYDDGVFPHGTIAVFNSRKESQVQAWTIWWTQGQFKAVSAIHEDIFALVQRNVSGVETLFFEQADPGYYTDCAVQVTNGSPTTSVTGLSHLNGESCRVRADGFVLSDVTPSGGAATIQQAGTNVEVGLDWTPEIVPMPLQTVGPHGSNFMRKRRVVNVAVKVRNTLGLRVNGRPLPDRYFDVDTFDEMATPYTGVHSLEESTNWDQTVDKIVSLTQVDPLPMEILALDIQIEGEA